MPNKSLQQGPWLMAAGFIVIGLLWSGVAGQQAWSRQSQLTAKFEHCMEQAPFRHSLKQQQPEQQLQPEDLQKHFDQFNQIFLATGLPPIWDGHQLVAWTTYHQDSIRIAKDCHQALKIERPQKQLRGTYAKPVWDPDSAIWIDSSTLHHVE